MSRRGKRTLRAVLNVTAWGDTNRRGHPEYWRYLLECGHVRYEHYCARAHVHALVAKIVTEKKGHLGFRKHCSSCAVGKPLEPDRLIVGDFAFLTEAQKAEVVAWMRANRKKRRK